MDAAAGTASREPLGPRADRACDAGSRDLDSVRSVAIDPAQSVAGAAPAPAALRLELRDGRLHLHGPEALGVELSEATVGAVVRRGKARMAWEADALQPDGLGAHWAETGLRIELRSEEVDGALVLRAIVENGGAEPLAIEEIAPLVVRAPRGAVRVGADSAQWAIFRNGYQSWSGTRVYRVDEADADPRFAFLRDLHVDPTQRASRRAGVFRSDLVTAIVHRPSGAALGVGFLDGRTAFSAVRVEAPRGRFACLAAVVSGDGVPLAPGERLELPALWLAAGGDGEALLAAWARAIGAAMHARIGERSPIGWCSWYYYFNRVRESDVLANLEAVTAMREQIRCDYVLVDDGYQRAVGDWLETNQRFPHGMRWVAARIRAAGFEPGIWLAPFLVRPDARLFRARPEWLLRHPNGRPRAACWNPLWGIRAPAYALDTTHPEVLEWLSQLARVLVEQWGFRVLKLDFLYAAALPAVRHDPTATRAEALRRGLQAIRDGAGDDAFLLGCGSPLGPAIGLVDGMRIGPDVAPVWSSWISRWLLRGRHGVATKHAIRNALTRAFMHRRLWLNDPDCVMVRADDTRLTLEEVRSLAAVVGLTDGLFVMSDNLPALSDERRAVLRDARELLGGTVRVCDLFERDLPELVHCTYDDGEVTGVFNFADAPRARMVTRQSPDQPAALREVWSGEALEVVDGRVALGRIPAHGCRLVWEPLAPPD